MLQKYICSGDTGISGNERKCLPECRTEKYICCKFHEYIKLCFQDLENSRTS